MSTDNPAEIKDILMKINENKDFQSNMEKLLKIEKVAKFINETIEDSVKDALNKKLANGIISLKDMSNFLMFGLDDTPVGIDGNVHIKLNTNNNLFNSKNLLSSDESSNTPISDSYRWYHIKTHKDMINALCTIPGLDSRALLKRNLDKLLTEVVPDTMDYNCDIIDFDNGHLDLVLLESRVHDFMNSNKNFSTEDFISIVMDVFVFDSFSVDPPRLSFNWDLCFDSKGCRGHSFIKETIADRNDRNNVFYFTGNALMNRDKLKKLISLFGPNRCGKSTIATYIGNLFKTAVINLKSFTSDDDFKQIPMLSKDIIIFGDTEINSISDSGKFKKLTARDPMDIVLKGSNLSIPIPKNKMPYCIATMNNPLKTSDNSVNDRFLYVKCQNGLPEEKQDHNLYLTLEEPVNLSYLLLKSLFIFFTSDVKYDPVQRDIMISLADGGKNGVALYVLNDLFIFDEEYDNATENPKKNFYLSLPCMRNLLDEGIERLLSKGLIGVKPKMSRQIVNSLAKWHFSCDNKVESSPARYPFIWNPDNTLGVDLEQFLLDTIDDNGDTYCMHCVNGYNERCEFATENVSLPGQESFME
jgi:hypothetical protein